MNFLRNVFFGLPRYYGISDMLIKIAVFIITTVVIIWLINLLLNKVVINPFKHYDGKTVHRDYFLKLTFLLSLAIFILMFSIYIGFYIYYIKIPNFKWSMPLFYAGFAPQLLVYLSIIIIFVLHYNKFNKILK